MERDVKETHSFNKAVKEGRFIFGVCRGLQLMSALNGLTLIQDMSHGGSHPIKVRNLVTNEFTETLSVNNIHHQCVWTNNALEGITSTGKAFKVYGYCNLSKKHHYQEGEEIVCFVEPEIIYFPETRSLGCQFHPEMMSRGPVLDYLDALLEKILEEEKVKTTMVA